MPTTTTVTTSGTPHPLAAGATTSEGILTKWAVIVGSVIAALGTASAVLQSAIPLLPDQSGQIGKWLAITGASLAGISSIAYSIQRTLLKLAAIQNGQVPPVDPVPLPAPVVTPPAPVVTPPLAAKLPAPAVSKPVALTAPPK